MNFPARLGIDLFDEVGEASAKKSAQAFGEANLKKWKQEQEQAQA